MANLPIRVSITQDSVNAVKSSEFNLDKTKGNAYRIDAIEFQIKDFDAIADGDEWSFQIASEDNNGGSLLNIDDEHEILTIGQEFHVLGTNGPVEDVQKIRKGFRVTGLETFITDSKFWLHFNTVGQDGVETLRMKIFGKYVNLKQKVIDEIQSGAVF